MMEQWKYEYLVNEWRGARSKPHELAVIGAFFNDTRLSGLRPVTQKCVHCADTRRLIDLYYPQINLGVEIDEGYHDSEPQRERDRIRADEIFTVSDCTLLRIKTYEQNVPSQIESAIRRTADTLEAARSSGEFNLWRKPEEHAFDSLRRNRKSTIFVKIRLNRMSNISEIDEFERRKRGSWRCAEWKARAARQIIVVSAGSQRIIDVLEIPPDSASKFDGKWSFSQAVSVDDPIVSDSVDWKANRCTRQYSFDLY